MSAVHPFFEFVLQHCHALCPVFVSCEGSSDTPACGPPFILEQTAFAHPAFFRTEAQSSSDWSLPFSVQQLVWARSQPNWLQHTGRSQPRRQLPQSCSVSTRVVLMDIDKTCPFEAFTRPHLKGPVASVVLLYVVGVPCNSFPSLSVLSSEYSRSPVSFLSILSA